MLNIKGLSSKEAREQQKYSAKMKLNGLIKLVRLNFFNPIPGWQKKGFDEKDEVPVNPIPPARSACSLIIYIFA